MDDASDIHSRHVVFLDSFMNAMALVVSGRFHVVVMSCFFWLWR